ncbi:hydroxypyruvate isomerase/GrpB-like predicted nucleotidyltransferase (UPF0157 family) [Methylobacterium sp. BE186]|nr:hydroxypyruvate isomerase/GrpB-like predicted nucleotidyltransferase (UPF0157 family) [Methylobacterium sp. BE186]
MPRFAANLSLLFTEHPFLDRFAAARDAGFPAVEFLFPYEHAPEAVARALRLSGLDLALFNMPPGDWAAGERGLAAIPGRFEAVAQGVERALAYAEATGVPRLHLMAGLAERADPSARSAYDRALRHAAGRLAEKGLDLTIEPINRRSMPGYFLDDVDWAAGRVAALRAEGHANLCLQLDLFHAQILHGDLTARLARLMPLIGHVQVASVPDRAEPGTGELNEAFLFGELDRLGYAGFVGCEYNPRSGTEVGLSWLAPYRAAPVGEGREARAVMSEALRLVPAALLDEARQRADALFQAVAGDLRAVLPPGSAIEHVGATAIPLCLTKGDLDVAIRVRPEDFETCRRILAGRFAPNAGSVATPTFRAFADAGSDPSLGLQLVVRESEFDVFTRFRDRLRAEPGLVAAYNALKLRHAGGAMETYRAAKSAFIAEVLSAEA